MKVCLFEPTDKGNKFVQEFKGHYQQFRQDYEIFLVGNINQAYNALKTQRFDAVLSFTEYLNNNVSNNIKNYINEKNIPFLILDATSTVQSVVDEVRFIIKEQQEKIEQAKKFDYEHYTFILGSPVIVDHKNGVTFTLTPNENLIFWRLFKDAGKIVEKIHLLNVLKTSNENLVENYIWKLRDKFTDKSKKDKKKDDENISLIKTVHGTGYRIELPPQKAGEFNQLLNNKTFQKIPNFNNVLNNQISQN